MKKSTRESLKKFGADGLWLINYFESLELEKPKVEVQEKINLLKFQIIKNERMIKELEKQEIANFRKEIKAKI
jgi:hypothetical protein